MPRRAAMVPNLPHEAQGCGKTGGAPSSSHTIPHTTSEWSVGLLHFDRVRLGYGSALGFGSEKV
ncbi:hypothetical protein WP2_073 [Pseudomonas phage WP2]